jgi:hypothetical protein
VVHETFFSFRLLFFISSLESFRAFCGLKAINSCVPFGIVPPFEIVQSDCLHLISTKHGKGNEQPHLKRGEPLECSFAL